MKTEKSPIKQPIIRLLLFVKNLYKVSGTITLGVILGWILTSATSYDRFYWNQFMGIFTLLFFISFLLKFLISSQRLEFQPLMKSEESFLNRIRYAYGWFNWKVQVMLGFALSPIFIKPEMTFLVKPDISMVSPELFPEKVYLYETYSNYSYYMFVSTILLFIGLMAFSYAMNIVLEERVFQDRSILKKEYTLYQRSILNKIFRKGSNKTNIPFDLKVLYLKPEYVDKFKVADLKITTEQTESSNLRLHRIEFVLEDKVTGMLLKKISIAALGEISNGKESLNTLPYKKTVLIGVVTQSIKKMKINLKQIKRIIKKLKEIQKKDSKIYIQKLKRKFLFLKLKIKNLIKNIQQKGKIQKTQTSQKSTKEKILINKKAVQCTAFYLIICNLDI